MPKGRDKNLIKLRNAALCRRWYYWTETQRLRSDDALRVLSQQEFFLSEERLLAIIRQCVRDNMPIKPVPKVRQPRITYQQFLIFTEEDDPVVQIRHGNKTGTCSRKP